MKHVLLALSLLSTSFAVPAYADDASIEFLKNLEGKFRGRGIAVLPASGSEQRVSCQLENIFSDGSNRLSINGRCATTQGKMEVSGELILQDDGSFEGVFLSPSSEVELKQSSVNFKNKTLTVSTVTHDKKKDKTTKARQVVEMNDGGNGFSSVFEYYNDESGKYESLGSITFKAKR